MERRRGVATTERSVSGRRIVAREAMVGELRLRGIAAPSRPWSGRGPRSTGRRGNRRRYRRACLRDRASRRAACPARACRCRRNPGCVIGGAGDAEMDLLGAGLAHHADDLHRGRAAHEAVVDEHDALALDRGAVRRMLHAHAELAHRLRRLDEGAADIMVADDAELVGNAAGLGEAERRRHAGIGHRDDDVGSAGASRASSRPIVLAHLVDVAPVHDGIGAGEIDVFEDAGAQRPAAARSGPTRCRLPRSPRPRRSRRRARSARR